MEAFDDIFQKINNSGIEHVQKIEIISLLKGKLEMLARKAINVDEMIDARGDVSKEKVIYVRVLKSIVLYILHVVGTCGNKTISFFS